MPNLSRIYFCIPEIFKINVLKRGSRIDKLLYIFLLMIDICHETLCLVIHLFLYGLSMALILNLSNTYILYQYWVYVLIQRYFFLS